MRLGSLREGIRLALDQLRANRMRSAITILGVVVGVTTVMAMAAVVTGVRSGIVDQIRAAGPRNFLVGRFHFDEARRADANRTWRDNPPVTDDEVRLIESLDEVRTAVVDFDFSVEMAVGRDRVDNVETSANSLGWSEFTVGEFVAGHDFLPTDVRSARPVVVLSEPLAETLFGRLDPVGRTVRVNGMPFRVVGVFTMEGNIFANVIKHFAVIPYTTASKHLNAWDGFLSALVVTAEDVTQAQAIDRVVGTLRSRRGLRPGEPDDFAIIRQEELLGTFNRMTAMFFVVMIALSSVALMVGGVGVVAVMMIAVTERTREIGVRKAVGATRREILWQFLVEAATLTVIGASVGMLFGGGLAFLVDTLTPVPASVPVWAVAAALAMAAIAGILFGMWPAWRAARMDPVVALRYE